MAVWGSPEYDRFFKLIVIRGDQESNSDRQRRNEFLVTFLGDAAGGRSGKANKPHPSPATTPGLDYKEKDVSHNGQKIRLQVWDTAGQERFRSVTSTFYRGSHGALVVFSLSQYPSFPTLKYWMKEIQDQVPKCCAYLVGILAVGGPQRQVSHAAMQEFAEEHKVEYHECELDNIGVNRIFMSLVSKLVDNSAAGESTDNGNSSKGTGDSFKATETNSSDSMSRSWCCWK